MHTCTLEQKSSFKKLLNFFFCLKVIVDEYKSKNTFHRTIFFFYRVTCSITLAKLWVKHLLQSMKCYYALIMPVFYTKHFTFSRTFKKEIWKFLLWKSITYSTLPTCCYYYLYRGTLGRLILFCLVNERGRYTSM